MDKLRVDFHVSKDLECKCTQRGNPDKVLEPIKVKRGDDKEREIEFKLMNTNYEFAGFISPQDKKHECFNVEKIGKRGQHSIMTVMDRFKNGASCDGLFDYELVFRKTPDPKEQTAGGNLYRYDPQIKNQ